MCECMCVCVRARAYLHAFSRVLAYHSVDQGQTVGEGGGRWLHLMFTHNNVFPRIDVYGPNSNELINTLSLTLTLPLILT